MKPSLPSAAADLARELRLHQIELETQNEELRRAQRELAAARDRYKHLFEVAPVGYLSLDEDGHIAELNLPGARLLGGSRDALIGTPFLTRLYHRERRRWRDHLAALVAGGPSGRLEARLALDEPGPSVVQLDTLRLPPSDPDPPFRVTLTDISERRAAEADRRITSHLLVAREAERLRVAQTLHEDLGQRLSALKIGLSLLPRDSPEPEADPGLAQAAVLGRGLDEAIAVVRRMANELRPAMLDDLGLNAAMQWLAQEGGRRLGLSVTLRAPDHEPQLEPRAIVGVYRLVEGLLAQIARDAGGAQVIITLHEDGSTLLLDLEVVAGGWPMRATPRAAGHDAIAGRKARTGLEHQALQAELRLLGATIAEPPATTGAYCLRVSLPLRASSRSRRRATACAR
jgi:PAS domain S-box-containing protein